MKKFVIIVLAASAVLSSCISKKKFNEAQKLKDDEIARLQGVSTECDKNKAVSDTKIKSLEDQVSFLKKANVELIDNVGNLTTLTTKGAETIEKSLESIKEKDTRIKSLSEALNKKDSVTVALVQSIKGVLGDLNDDDIQVNVEKGVVYVSISDKLLFESGSYSITPRAKVVLGKVAKVINNKPEFEIMIEGHTDDQPIKNAVLQDNWDLSVKRATSVVRILQEDYKVKPERMVAAGRSYYTPLASNKTTDGRSKNRRTRIILLPKLDQFYKMIDDGLKEAK